MGLKIRNYSNKSETKKSNYYFIKEKVNSEDIYF